MTDKAVLVDSDGRPIAPGSLSWRGVKAGPELVAAARHLAYRNGRVIEHDDTAIYASGVAARIDFPFGSSEPNAAAVATALLGELSEDANAETGSIPVALGALSFDPKRKGSLLVPRFSVVSDRGRGDYAVAVDLKSEDARREPLGEENSWFKQDTELADDPAPDRFEIASRRSEDDYRDRVRAAVAAIRAGELEKVVLARELSITANRAFRQRDLVARLRGLHPMCAVFAVDGFIGATPELLVSRRGHTIASRPLAGTVPRKAEAADDAALVAKMRASAKENSEHRFVVDDVVRTFKRYATDLEASAAPEVFQLANVTHLATSLKARLDDRQGRAPVPGAFELALELHPTSAVAGTPRDIALSYLERFEAIDRERYAGPVGWVDANGDGEWWIGIRSALVDGQRARLIAGAGIVADSDPDSELEETTAKFEALVAAFTNNAG